MGILRRFSNLCISTAKLIIVALLGRQQYRSLAKTVTNIPALRVIYCLSQAMIVSFIRNNSLCSIKLLEGTRFIAPDFNDLISHIRSIWGKGIYDKYKVSTGQVVVDAGAHVGVYAVKASKNAGENGIIVAVEPHPLNFNLLRINLKINNCRNVTTVNAALASECGERPLFLGINTTAHSTAAHSDTLQSSHDAISVASITLDQLAKQLNLPKIDLIKINIEGATIDMLKGATEVIRLWKPKIVAAVNHYTTEQEEATRFLNALGFAVKAEGDLIFAEPAPSLCNSLN